MFHAKINVLSVFQIQDYITVLDWMLGSRFTQRVGDQPAVTLYESVQVSRVKKRCPY